MKNNNWGRMLHRIAAMTMIFVFVFTMSSAAESKEPQAPAKPIAVPNITVAEGVELIVQQMKLNIDHIRFIKQPLASDYFTSVPDDAAYAEAFIIAHLNGLEVPKDIDPNALITKEQYLHFLTKALVTKGTFPMIEIYMIVNDENKVTPEYMSSIQTMLILKVVKTDKNGNISPQSNLTKGEAMLRIRSVQKFMKEIGLALGHPESQEPVENPDEPVSSDEVKVTTEAVNDEVNKVTVSWGEKPHAGYKTFISSIEFAGDEAIVYYKLQEPEEGRMYAQVITEAKAETYVASQYKITAKPAQ